MYFWEVIIVLG